MAVLAPKKAIVIGGVLVAVVVLYVLGSEKRRNENAEPAANPSQCRVTVIADVLRVHDGPQLAAPVVGRLTKGQETNADKVVQNGFRKIGDNRWVSVDYAQPLSGHDCG